MVDRQENNHKWNPFWGLVGAVIGGTIILGVTFVLGNWAKHPRSVSAMGYVNGDVINDLSRRLQLLESFNESK